jgi:hypothetical protein
VPCPKYLLRGKQHAVLPTNGSQFSVEIPFKLIDRGDCIPKRADATSSDTARSMRGMRNALAL